MIRSQSLADGEVEVEVEVVARWYGPVAVRKRACCVRMLTVPISPTPLLTPGTWANTNAMPLTSEQLEPYL